MEYRITTRPKALKDLQQLDATVQRRIVSKIEELKVDLHGDVKRLAHFVPEHRLRVGDWRVLFQVAGDEIVIHRVLHRSKAYNG